MSQFPIYHFLNSKKYFSSKSLQDFLSQQAQTDTLVHTLSNFVLNSMFSYQYGISIVQGGLEIPCQVTVEMEMTDKNSLAIAEYKRLVSEQYQEPVNRKFPDDTQQILQALQSPSDEELDYHSDSSTSESETVYLKIVKL